MIMKDILQALLPRRKLKLKAEIILNGKELEKITYTGIHRAGFAKLFLGYALFVTYYEEYDDHIVAYFEDGRPIYFSYCSDTDYTLMYADEVENF